MARRTAVGELRPSQLLHIFGVGSIVDLPNISAMVMGLDDWDVSQCKPIVEQRLLAAVREQLGEQVARLVTPPMPQDDGVKVGFQPETAEVIGVPVTAFPRTMRCPQCNRLGARVRGIFDLKTDPYHPDRTRYVHTNCQKGGGHSAVLPARFVVACGAGHLDDFPWTSYVHNGPTDCHGALSLHEMGISGEAAEVEVRCVACEASRRMADAFGEAGLGYPCRGRRPHLRDYDENVCREPTRTILLGASNSWFSVTLSALYVPPGPKDRLAELVEDRWAKLAEVDAPNVVTFLRKQGELGPLAAFGDPEIWKAIDARRTGPNQPEAGDLKGPEWRVITAPASAPQSADFRLCEVTPPTLYAHCLERVVLAERLREVTALTGFTRIASPMDYEDVREVESKHRAPLSRKAPVFVPASEVRGEGIFLQFRESVMAGWCSERESEEELLEKAHRRWRMARKIVPPEAGFPGIRYALLHSFSHALMRQLALECGYAASGIRERIYSQNPQDHGGPMAGILVYTAAPDSEGTLGGLVSLGRPAELQRHIEQALEQMRLCSSDPLCADHLPGGSGNATLHGAACHACLFSPETSCERSNHYLDRTLLVETIGHRGGAFFRSNERA